MAGPFLRSRLARHTGVSSFLSSVLDVSKPGGRAQRAHRVLRLNPASELEFYLCIYNTNLYYFEAQVIYISTLHISKDSWSNRFRLELVSWRACHCRGMEEQDAQDNHLSFLSFLFHLRSSPLASADHGSPHLLSKNSGEEAEISTVQGQPQLHRVFWATLSYMKPFLKNRGTFCLPLVICPHGVVRVKHGDMHPLPHLLRRLKWEENLRSGVQGQPGQHSETVAKEEGR